MFYRVKKVRGLASVQEEWLGKWQGLLVTDCVGGKYSYTYLKECALP